MPHGGWSSQSGTWLKQSPVATICCRRRQKEMGVVCTMPRAVAVNWGVLLYVMGRIISFWSDAAHTNNCENRRKSTTLNPQPCWRTGQTATAFRRCANAVVLYPENLIVGGQGFGDLLGRSGRFAQPEFGLERGFVVGDVVNRPIQIGQPVGNEIVGGIEQLG